MTDLEKLETIFDRLTDRYILNKGRESSRGEYRTFEAMYWDVFYRHLQMALEVHTLEGECAMALMTSLAYLWMGYPGADRLTLSNLYVRGWAGEPLSRFHIKSNLHNKITYVLMWDMNDSYGYYGNMAEIVLGTEVQHGTPWEFLEQLVKYIELTDADMSAYLKTHMAVCKGAERLSTIQNLAILKLPIEERHWAGVNLDGISESE